MFDNTQVIGKDIKPKSRNLPLFKATYDYITQANFNCQKRDIL